MHLSKKGDKINKNKIEAQLIISTVFVMLPARARGDVKGVVAEGGLATVVLVDGNNIRFTVVLNGELS